jgi:hypothetical protein
LAAPAAAFAAAAFAGAGFAVGLTAALDAGFAAPPLTGAFPPPDTFVFAIRPL